MLKDEKLLITIPCFQEVFDKLQVLEKKLEQIAKQTPLEETWLNNQEVAKLLKVTPRTLINYRCHKLISYSQIGSKIYYKASDVQAFLESHHVRSEGRRGEL